MGKLSSRRALLSALLALVLTGLLIAPAARAEAYSFEDAEIYMWDMHNEDGLPYPGEQIDIYITLIEISEGNYYEGEWVNYYTDALISAINLSTLVIEAERYKADELLDKLVIYTGEMPPLNADDEFLFTMPWEIPGDYLPGDIIVLTARILSEAGDELFTNDWQFPLDYARLSQSLNFDDFTPFEGEYVATLDEPATLSFTSELPILDGAKALYPVYAAFAQAVYPPALSYADLWDSPVRMTNTINCYEALVNGEADVIFVAQPSPEQLLLAENAGVSYSFTPICYEAFVFVVSEDNPVDGLTVDDIRHIYSGEATHWGEFGAPELGEIVAYQRNENSGSQTTLQYLMGDTRLVTPPKEYSMDAMEDILVTANYKNSPNAIGFSFRYYTTVMQRATVKLLALDGVYPSEENIANGTYPVISTLYAVTLGDESEHTRMLLDWITGEQGQALVKAVGYTPVN